jgi:hypothetical protein
MASNTRNPARSEETNGVDPASAVTLLGKDKSYLWHDPAPLAPDVTPGSLYMHELLDRTHAVLELLEQVIWQHPAIGYDEDWKHLAFTAQCALAELYQRVSAVRFADSAADAAYGRAGGTGRAKRRTKPEE